MIGGSGADVLVGWPGRDRMEAETGVDRILARDGERDQVSCNALEGDRVIVDADDATYGCDHVDRAGPKRLELIGLQHATPWRLVVACPRAASPDACVGRLRLGPLNRNLRVAPGRHV